MTGFPGTPFHVKGMVLEHFGVHMLFIGACKIPLAFFGTFCWKETDCSMTLADINTRDGHVNLNSEIFGHAKPMHAIDVGSAFGSGRRTCELWTLRASSGPWDENLHDMSDPF